MALYEAQMDFTHPHVDRRFRQHRVYDLDEGAVASLAKAIERGKLVAVPDYEVEAYLYEQSQGVPPVADATPPSADDPTDGDGDDEDEAAAPVPDSSSPLTDPSDAPEE